MKCSKCGGDMAGDGYVDVIHCENAEYEKYFDRTPDDNPIECAGTEEDKHD